MVSSSLTPKLDCGPLATIGWALFLGLSWTWCIGMYLPVLMVRDFGVAGWIVFAIPNVVGAAAMGWMLKRPGAAADLARKHWPAAIAFSVVTILFHAFFVGWIIRALVGDSAEIITAAAAGGFYFFGRRGHRDLLVAAALFAFSIAAFIIAASMPAVHPIGPIGVKPLLHLVYLAPVCIFGFFLCPYLDLTFLRARAATEFQTGIAAFIIGFGGFFLAMLLFTLWYSRLIQPGNLNAIPPIIAWIIGGHMMLQTAYTVALHTRAIFAGDFLTPSPGTPGEGWGDGLASGKEKDPHPSPLPEYRARGPEGAAATLLVAIVLAFLLGAFGTRILPARCNPEMIYRLFMGFYGLVFPAYVWLCMIPAGNDLIFSPQRKMIVLAVALIVAAPMFWLGFIADQMVWLVPGLLVVMLSRLALSSGMAVNVGK